MERDNRKTFEILFKWRYADKTSSLSETFQIRLDQQKEKSSVCLRRLIEHWINRLKNGTKKKLSRKKIESEKNKNNVGNSRCKKKTWRFRLEKNKFSGFFFQAGQEFLKQAWGEEKLNQVNAMLEARDKTDDEAKASGDSAAPPEEAPTSSSSSETSPAPPKAPAKPKLSKARTMKATADVNRPKQSDRLWFLIIFSFSFRKENPCSAKMFLETRVQKQNVVKQLSTLQKLLN